MTSGSHHSLAAAQEAFDTGPLSWVMPEIREAISRADRLLLEAPEQVAETQSTTLLHAKSYLHQAHGALQIVDIDGVSIITETIEDLIERLQSQQLVLTPVCASTISDAFNAVLRYLEDLLAGAAHQPVRLFSNYRDLLELIGADRIHPADLFFPSLSVQEKIPELSIKTQVAPINYANVRQRFEKLLLTVLTSKDDQQRLPALRMVLELVQEVEQAQTNAQAKAFWLVMRAFTEAAAQGKIENQQYVKQIFGRINLQIRRLVDGITSIPERLLRDALFFIAQAPSPSAFVGQIKKAYQLDNQVPTNYQQKNQGQIPTAKLLAAKEQLNGAKNLWGRIANGDAALSEKFAQKIQDLAETGASLQSPALLKLLRELSDIALPATALATGGKIGLELASGLLFVESAIDQITHLPNHFSERADEITARLLVLVAGDEPPAQAAWMGEIVREAQQRQTMATLVGEMQTSLRQVEKTLDDYFREPGKPELLAPVGAILHQIGGAMAILDQDDAQRAIEYTRNKITEFGQHDDAQTQQGNYQNVAQNIGALSFFIETLQTQPEHAKKKFVFDAEQGLFRSNLLEKASDKSLLPHASMALDHASVAPVSSEDELAHQQIESARLASTLAAQPDNLAIQAQLKDSLASEISVAAILDDANASARAQSAIELLAQVASGDIDESNDAVHEIIAVTAPEKTDHGAIQSHALSSPLPASDEAIDAELLEIFLTEADEVLAFVNQTVPVSRLEPGNQEHLTSLRRSFHTLKGSGRMVGLSVFGEAAWSVEQVMNLWLSEARNGSEALYDLLDYVASQLTQWVDDLKATGVSKHDADAIIAAAELVKAGLEFKMDVAAEQVDAPVISVEEVDIGAAALAEFDALMAVQSTDGQVVANEMPDDAPNLAVLDGNFSEANTALEHRTETLQADISKSDALEEVAAPVSDDGLVLQAEASTEDEQSDHDDQVGDLEPQQPIVSAEVINLADSADTAPVSEVDGDENVVSNVANTAVNSAEIIDFPAMQALTAPLDDTVKRIGSLDISLQLHTIYMSETDEIVRYLGQEFAEWRHEPARAVARHAVYAAHSLAGSSATVGLHILQELAHAIEMVLQRLERHPVELEMAEFDVLEQSIVCAKQMLQKFALSEMPEPAPLAVMHLEKLLRTVILRSNAGEDEEFITSTNEKLDPVILADLVDHAEPETEAPASVPEAVAFDNNGGEIKLNDDLDTDLLPVFIEEGHDLLPMVGQLLRSWQQNPEDMSIPQSILRLMHTIKGSARMAGAMQLGQHVHEMEARIESLMYTGSDTGSTVRPPLLDDLLARHDFSMQLFERLQNPATANALASAEAALTQSGLTAAQELDQFLDNENRDAASTAIQEHSVVQSTAPEITSVPALAQISTVTPSGILKAVPNPASLKASVTTPAAAGALVRVRADILDRLVNQAGEVSISRSKLENEVATLRSSLSELTDNVTRLRDQLREVEIQAETQITSRMAHSADREFDPLEFDRFTRLQELTRMMAESVSDVASVQQNLHRTIDDASNDLHTQARLTRELQQDLMRVRMIPFASVAERLYRVTRQASKEMDKRVNLDIRGTAVEMDRSVLEKMVGPFEHLLRNAIVHGIESKEQRVAAGKQEVGELLIEIRQEGNEVVIHFTDDGQGLNLERIRHKAQSVGLLEHDGAISDSEVVNLIFEPGFSTASEVTELAGRGVGMDVVRSEATALGGRVAVHSVPGQGAHFTIHLPLTLAVTQVVIISAGGKTFAVPSVLVEQVQQLKVAALTAAYNDGAIMWQGARVPMYYLPSLLGERQATAITQQYSPLLVMKSGSERVAIHVDDILGNREVVVKNIGPQLARMIGIAGATVLGSGDIVLILNPVPLAQRMEHEHARNPHPFLTDGTADSGVHQNLSQDQGDAMTQKSGAVAELSAHTAVPVAVAGLRTQPIIMVVDDSLTVRRVTQRLLVREGYQVVLAKDGIDALEQLQSVTPDVMLVDIEMPRMDGFDLTRNVRGDARSSQIPIIMITSRTADKHRNYAAELGVNAYFGKPYREEELLAAIEGFVHKAIPADIH
jgi:chemosensory pili system protein ChpA (sensor histidine kinase/response regulator)